MKIILNRHFTKLSVTEISGIPYTLTAILLDNNSWYET